MLSFLLLCAIIILLYYKSGRDRETELRMTVTEALWCGLLQGAAEFLPISSSGHLALFHAFFGGEAFSGSNLTFDILLHLATLFAVFIVYFKNIIALIPAFFTLCKKLLHGRFSLSEYSEGERTVVCLFFGTLPLAAALFIKDAVETAASYPKIVGALLILNAIVLLFGDKGNGTKALPSLKAGQACAVGIFQLLAVFPGLSRSGSTIAGGSLMGLSREEAVRFSFLLSIPAVLGANVTNISALGEISRGDIPLYAVGMAAALVSGFAAIKLLIFISKKSNFRIFACYCALVGAMAILFG